MRIVTREVTLDDQKNGSYYSHMGGLVGVVSNYFGPTEVAINVDRDSLQSHAQKVHTESEKRMRTKFIEDLSEAAKAMLEDDEKKFDVNYVVLAKETDLEKI